MLVDPVLKEPNRRAVAQRRVTATPVIEHLDEIEQMGLRTGSHRAVRAMPSHFLQADEENLGVQVVPAVAHAAHQSSHVVQGLRGRHGRLSD